MGEKGREKRMIRGKGALGEGGIWEKEIELWWRLPLLLRLQF